MAEVVSRSFSDIDDVTGWWFEETWAEVQVEDHDEAARLFLAAGVEEPIDFGSSVGSGSTTWHTRRVLKWLAPADV